MVGYIGCSNTAMSVKGYHDIGGSNFWQPQPLYAGGTISEWVNSSPKYWAAFDSIKQPNTTKVWIEICIRDKDKTNVALGDAVTVIRDLREKMATRVYASALNPYPDHICAACGPTGPQRSQKIVDWLVQKGMCQAGPKMPGLYMSDCVADGCHPNPQAQKKLGQALLDFFG